MVRPEFHNTYGVSYTEYDGSTRNALFQRGKSVNEDPLNQRKMRRTDLIVRQQAEKEEMTRLYMTMGRNSQVSKLNQSFAIGPLSTMSVYNPPLINPQTISLDQSFSNP